MMEGFIIKSEDKQFMCDLIDFLANYQIDRSKQNIIFQSSDIEQYEDARDFIRDYDYEDAFRDYRNSN